MDTQAGVDSMILNNAGIELDLGDLVDLEWFADTPSTPTNANTTPPFSESYCTTPTPEHGSIDRENVSAPKPIQYNQDSFLANVTMAPSPTYDNTRQRSSSTISPSYSLNQTQTLDNWPAFQFVQPLTPSISSRSTSPVSSTASAVIDITLPQNLKAAKYIRENLQREYDQRVTEVEYRLRKEYLDSLDVELQQEQERCEKRYQAHFEKLLRQRMKEVIDQYNEQCDANRTEFEEILKERMAEVQATCNETVEDKDKEVARLKARLKKATAMSQTSTKTKKHGGTVIRRKEEEAEGRRSRRNLRRKAMSDSESEYVPSDVGPKSTRKPTLALAPAPAFASARTADETSDPPYLKDASIEELRDKFFRLQLIVSTQHSQLEQMQEDLALYREKLANVNLKCQCGAQASDERIQPPEQLRVLVGEELNPDSEMISSDVSISTPSRPLSSSPRWQPYPSPSPSPSAISINQPTEITISMPVVRSRDASQTPSPLGSPFQTPSPSVMKKFPRNLPIWSGGSYGRCVDLTPDEEEIDELCDDEDLDEPWIISG